MTTPENDQRWLEAMRHPSTIEAGEIISFDTVNQLDIFAINLGLFSGFGAKGYYPIDEFDTTSSLPVGFDGTVRHEYLRRGVKPPSVALRPSKSFAGQIINLIAIPLESGPMMEGSGSSAMVASGMYKSSGRPASTPFFTKLVVRKPVNNYRLNITYKPVKNTGSPEEILDTLIDDSAEVSRRVVLYGLRHVFRGGLPG